MEGAGPVEQDQSGDGVGTPNVDQPNATQEGMGHPSMTGQALPNPMGFDSNASGFSNVPWSGAENFNPMAQFMANGMFNNFQNPMGMFCCPTAYHSY